MKLMFVFLIWISVIVPSCRHATDNYPAYKLIPRTGEIREKEGQEALQILDKVLALTARVNENRASNAYEARVLSTMSNFADEDLRLALNKFTANRIAAKNENSFPHPTKELSVGSGKNWILMWSRGFHEVEVMEFFRNAGNFYILELKCVREPGKIDSGYTDVTKLKFQRKNGHLKLSNVFTRREGSEGFHEQENLMNYLKFRHQLKGGNTTNRN